MDEKELTRAKNAAYRYLSFRPRSRAEVEGRLVEKGFSESTIQTVLIELDRLGFVNDHEFARQWARSRVRLRGFGRHRIERELKEKGVNSDFIRETLVEVFEDASEADIARLEVEKKLKSLARFDIEIRRRRLAHFLQRKGFPFDIIHAVIREIR